MSPENQEVLLFLLSSVPMSVSNVSVKAEKRKQGQGSGWRSKEVFDMTEEGRQGREKGSQLPLFGKTEMKRKLFSNCCCVELLENEDKRKILGIEDAEL